MSVADLLADIPDLAHIDDPFLGFSQACIPIPPRITLVTSARVELAHLSISGFESEVSTDSTTKPYFKFHLFILLINSSKVIEHFVFFLSFSDRIVINSGSEENRTLPLILQRFVAYPWYMRPHYICLSRLSHHA